MNGNRKENAMDEFKFNVETTVIGAADGKETFEVRKQYNVGQGVSPSFTTSTITESRYFDLLRLFLFLL